MREIFVDPETLTRFGTEVLERAKKYDVLFVDHSDFNQMVLPAASAQLAKDLKLAVEKQDLRLSSDTGRKSNDLDLVKEFAHITENRRLTLASFLTFRRKYPEAFFLSANSELVLQLNILGCSTIHFQRDGDAISRPASKHEGRDIEESVSDERVVRLVQHGTDSDVVPLQIAEPSRTGWVPGWGWFLFGVVLTVAVTQAVEHRELFINAWPRWGAAVCCVFAAGFFLLRCRARIVYGLIEVGFGVWSVSNAAGRIDLAAPEIPALIQLAASLYIVVRGLDNVDQGWKPRPVDEIWQWVFKGRPLTSKLKSQLKHCAEQAIRGLVNLPPKGW